MTVPGLILTSFLVSLYHLAWFVAASKLVTIGANGKLYQRLAVIIALSSFWVVIEWSGVFSRLVFHGVHSQSLSGKDLHLQLVPSFGAWIVSFFSFFFNLSIVLFAQLLVRRRRKFEPYFQISP